MNKNKIRLSNDLLLFNCLSREPKGYMFYYPNHRVRFVESGNAKFLENDEVSGNDKQVVEINDEKTC